MAVQRPLGYVCACACMCVGLSFGRPFYSEGRPGSLLVRLGSLGGMRDEIRGLK